MDLIRGITFIFVSLLLLSACREVATTSGSSDNFDVISDPDSSGDSSIFIVDYTGKQWDITHAVNEYGFKAEQFQYGLGPYAIRPILEPEMLSPGEEGYPASDDNNTIVGVVLEGEVRAYPLDILRRYEIADEIMGKKHVAVGY
jgi:hypothetical protein